MTKKIILVGQGIAGSALAFELVQAGTELVIFDAPASMPPSTMQAGGLLHSFNRKNFTVQEKYEAALAHALGWYSGLEKLLDRKFMYETKLVVWPSVNQCLQTGNHVRDLDKQEAGSLSPYFYLNGQVQMVWPVYRLDVPLLLSRLKQFLKERATFIEETSDVNKIQLLNYGVRYESIEAGKIIFCEGAYGASNPYFCQLPFVYNKADLLWLRIPLPETLPFVFENELRLVPAGNGLFWCGATHSWNNEDALPNLRWQQETMEKLSQWLKLPMQVVKHVAARRPTTVAQFPFAGLHPFHSQLGILNGMGTRGLMHAPALAAAFAKYLSGSSESIAGYDTARFQKFFK